MEVGSGGRHRTRTCDLLHVKRTRGSTRSGSVFSTSAAATDLGQSGCSRSGESRRQASYRVEPRFAGDARKRLPPSVLERDAPPGLHLPDRVRDTRMSPAFGRPRRSRRLTGTHPAKSRRAGETQRRQCDDRRGGPRSPPSADISSWRSASPCLRGSRPPRSGSWPCRRVRARGSP